MRPALVAAFIGLVGLAGCTAPVTSPSDDVAFSGPGPDPWPAIRDVLAGVPCEVSSVGEQTTENLLPLAALPLEAPSHGEVDLRPGWALVAHWLKGGFEVVDLSDPIRPELVATFDDDRGALDVKFGPDGSYALLAHPRGIVIVDVAEPTAPRKVGEWKFPAFTLSSASQLENAHMLALRRIGNEDWVFLAPNSNTGIWILRVDGTATERSLKLVTQTAPVGGGPGGPHDMFVVEDETTSRWLLYTADGYLGWSVFDVSDPARPQRIGGSVLPETGYTHTVQAAWFGDRRIVATVAEQGGNLLKVWDATKLDAPTLLGVWHAPPIPVLAQHNLNFAGGRLYVAHYSKGLYVFDPSKLPSGPTAVLDLAPVAHYAPSSVSIWDVLVQDGLVYAGTLQHGLHVVGYGCNAAGDPGVRSLG